jgi:hypothetical protein
VVRFALLKEPAMFLHQRFIPGFAIASYIVGDEKVKEVAVTDPTRDVEEYVRIARENRVLKRQLGDRLDYAELPARD